MSLVTKQALTNSSAIAWIIDRQFKTERREPFEFVNHRFLIDYMADDHDDIVATKCSQVGATLAETFDDFFLAGKQGLNVIHTLQNSDVIKGFVVPKVDPVIAINPDIKKMLKADSQNLKQFNNNYVFFRGASTESQAINISADVLKIDELDRSDQKVVETFQSRLDYSSAKKIKRFSNPSSIGFGVDGLWQDSDQRHWFVTCSHCNHEWYMDFFQAADKPHYVDQERHIYACGKCHKEIYTADRIRGRWVQRYPLRAKRHGYWFSQMMSPWFTASQIIDKYEGTSLDVFYNFTLGKAYTPSDLIVNRETILRACAPSSIAKLNVVMGVDQNVNEQIWVAGTPQGIFAHGRTKSWEELEDLKLRWNAVVVCDPNPYPTKPKQLAAKYNDFYLCYFKQQIDGMSLLQWKEPESIVYADRTRLLDTVANEITEARLLFREHPYALEDYIADWSNLYRTTVESADGHIRSTWLKKENKESDFSFATAYMRIALSRIIQSGGSNFIEPMDQPNSPVTYTARKDNKLETDLDAIVEETLADLE